jgi:hypothetical protein
MNIKTEISVGTKVSVKLSDAPNPVVGEVVEIDDKYAYVSFGHFEKRFMLSSLTTAFR